MRFLDTNVLMYAALNASGDPAKRRQARELLRDPDLAMSVQVLQEFYWQATHPARTDRLAHDQAMAFLRLFRHKPLQPMTREIFEQAVAISQRHRLSYWDSAILAAAQALGCDAVYSEDLSIDQDYDGLRVLNPFTEAIGNA